MPRPDKISHVFLDSVNPMALGVCDLRRGADRLPNPFRACIRDHCRFSRHKQTGSNPRTCTKAVTAMLSPANGDLTTVAVGALTQSPATLFESPGLCRRRFLSIRVVRRDGALDQEVAGASRRETEITHSVTLFKIQQNLTTVAHLQVLTDFSSGFCSNVCDMKFRRAAHLPLIDGPEAPVSVPVEFAARACDDAS